MSEKFFPKAKIEVQKYSEAQGDIFKLQKELAQIELKLRDANSAFKYAHIEYAQNKGYEDEERLKKVIKKAQNMVEKLEDARDKLRENIEKLAELDEETGRILKKRQKQFN